MSNTRKRVCGIMNKERSDFEQTPAYDDFLELREDLINKFIRLYDTTGTVSSDGGQTCSREELEKILHRFELENQEQIIQARSTADERKKRKIEEIIDTEGTLYDRINADFSERDAVIDHELAVQYADLLSGSRINGHTSQDLINRKTRLIKMQPPSDTPSVPVIAEASGCKGLWLERARHVIQSCFS